MDSSTLRQKTVVREAASTTVRKPRVVGSSFPTAILRYVSVKSIEGHWHGKCYPAVPSEHPPYTRPHPHAHTYSLPLCTAYTGIGVWILVYLINMSFAAEADFKKCLVIDYSIYGGNWKVFMGSFQNNDKLSYLQFLLYMHSAFTLRSLVQKMWLTRLFYMQ